MEDAFLRQLLADPDDDITRLVYADWLEERGDPRGRYLRLEQQLAHLSTDDEAYPALEAELMALGEGLDLGWLAQAGKRYCLVLHGYAPTAKIPIIKSVREITLYGLKEAKDFVELPLPAVVPVSLLRPEAERFRERFSLVSGQRVVDLRIVVGPHPRTDVPLPPGEYELSVDNVEPDKRDRFVGEVCRQTGMSREAAERFVDYPYRPLHSRLSNVEAWNARTALEGLAQVHIRRTDVPPVTHTGPPPRPAFVPCDLVLLGYPPANKFQVIRVLRQITPLGLAECKQLVESLPAVLLRGHAESAVRGAMELFGELAQVEARPAS